MPERVERERFAGKGARLVVGARGVPEEDMTERQGEFLDSRARHCQEVKDNSYTILRGDSDCSINDDQHQAERSPQSRGSGGWVGGTERGGCALSWDAAACDGRRHGASRSGVDEVRT